MMDQLVYIVVVYGYLLPTIILFVDILWHVCCKVKKGERFYSGYMKKQMMTNRLQQEVRSQREAGTIP